MGELGRLTPFADLDSPPPAPGEPIMATRVVEVHEDLRHPDRMWARLDTGLELAIGMDDLMPTRFPASPTVSSIMYEQFPMNPCRAMGIYLGLSNP